MDNYIIPASSLLRVLQGIVVATKLPQSKTEPLVQCFSGGVTGTDIRPADRELSLSVGKWRDEVYSIPEENKSEKDGLQHLSNLAIGIAFLREQGRQSQDAVTGTELATVWEMVHGALTSALLSQPQFQASRSAQGFLAVPLCSLIENGNISELFRLHVWLPDGQRGAEAFAVHSHQPFAQSWILAGEGVDHSFNVEGVTDEAMSTHAEYRLAWNDGKNTGASYKTHQISSTVVRSGRMVRVIPTGSKVHTRDMSYTIPAAVFHQTTVQPDTLHATLFFFDASRGFVKDAPVLGPKDMESSTQLRDPAGVTPAALATMVEAVRAWEILMDQGQAHSERAEWEHALRSFSHALSLCGPASKLPNPDSYNHIVLARLGYTNRRFGRYEKAEGYLEAALQGLGSTPLHVEVSGELGVVYRHMNRLEDAKRAFEKQYEISKALNLERATCRAIGNLGMVNYQCSQEMLDLAIEQLKERVERAELIKRSTAPEQRSEPTVWKTIGLSRLSLCYTAKGLKKEATDAASEALKAALDMHDPTVTAMSQFFYGRALLLDGQKKEALQHFNPVGTCTPAMALCKEPSDEHLVHLREVVDAGANMDLVDEHGYSALDYAVFCGSKPAEEVVLDGLRRQFLEQTENELLNRKSEARIRKCYRELFQEHLRPVLLDSDGADRLQHLRRVYAETLAADKEKSAVFDGFKFVWFSDFVLNGRLPRSNHGLTQHLKDLTPDKVPDYVVFISYRWIGDGTAIPCPDDNNHSQYQRMIQAVNQFLASSSVNAEKLGIWLDWACVNQDNPSPGVSALPLNLAQCDAVISLLDNDYHSRAWCSVEVMMVQMLRKSYHLHSWYEHTKFDTGDWVLHEGPLTFKPEVAGKRLSCEQDRARILFLERQTRLLGRVE
ncbi:hypothetical protein ASPWEDRAFT_44796 [Aspergillus wentii DTO 134E9]|uniref:Uncharacterized protein n=1 Tax=Aspergillus wentii DTO 134E9 TaxID=1073089 RepID=A0A1L9R7B3_ASPWE|nr:uncharacterized protein ASPWEDRAFT_44796 [Aspergillus wentii DTO 134E9]OJJ30811.1 hypothetical protein ASPWEDRAFT_44796 [Aspergillus wentii DTO 134E9]